MSVSQQDAKRLTSLKDEIEYKISRGHEELTPIYEKLYKTRNKEQALRQIARYFYYELKLKEKFENEILPNDTLSQSFHSAKAESAYFEYKNFEEKINLN